MTEQTIPPELIERMAALCRHAAVSASGHTQEEARAIVAELPEPVDPDEEEARQIMRNWPTARSEPTEHDIAIGVALIKRGRALAAEGK